MLSEVMSVSVCAGSFLYIFYVLGNFMYFLSSHNDHLRKSEFLQTDENVFLATTWSLLVDSCLLSIFMLQHSFMASDRIKRIYERLNLEHMERCIYNATSAGVLHLLLNKWVPIPWLSLWNVDTSENNSLWFAFVVCHIFGWAITYSGCLMMDISELAGLKQAYYKISSIPPPMSMKSRELQRYFTHMRHPSFTGFLILLWIHPFMTLDRVLLSLLLSTYMVLMWGIDQQDYNYHANVIQRKRRQLS